jgi:hypothetical protein
MRTGTSTGVYETSPRYKRKKARQRRAEEARWKSLSGPVTVIQVDPSTLVDDLASRAVRPA